MPEKCSLRYVMLFYMCTRKRQRWFGFGEHEKIYVYEKRIRKHKSFFYCYYLILFFNANSRRGEKNLKMISNYLILLYACQYLLLLLLLSNKKTLYVCAYCTRCWWWWSHWISRGFSTVLKINLLRDESSIFSSLFTNFYVCCRIQKLWDDIIFYGDI
jgi:hypothetical protein